VATGVAGRQGRRNAPALINRGYGRTFFWAGRAVSLEEQVLQPIQDPNEMNLTLDELSARLKMDSKTIARALASYIRSILSGDSPYDRFVNGDTPTSSGSNAFRVAGTSPAGGRSGSA
jgi:cytochrome c peroxidase